VARQKLAEVENDIGSTRSKIGQQEVEVSRYTGGLVYATSLATLVTMGQTLAMLELRRVSLKYRLQPQIPAGHPNGTGTPTAQIGRGQMSQPA
jgi:hypothetical protein